MFGKYPLFQSHLDLAHNYWKQLVSPGDTVVDATCGNGYDALLLAQLALKEPLGSVWLLDIQSTALENSRQLLEKSLSVEALKRVEFVVGSHANFPSSLARDSVKLVVYNLGYLPGGDKSLTTCVETTLASVKEASLLIQEGGALSITCYPGHPEGAREEQALLEMVSQWDPRIWSVCHHRWCNRSKSPSLLLLQRSGYKT